VKAVWTATLERNAALGVEFGMRGDFVIGGRATHPSLTHQAGLRKFGELSFVDTATVPATMPMFCTGRRARRGLRIAVGIGGRVAAVEPNLMRPVAIEFNEEVLVECHASRRMRIDLGNPSL
jgi:hypothetical protein